MKSFFASIALAVALFAGAPAHAAVESGKPAPDATFTDTKGISHTLSAFKGKTVVLEWTNPGCPFVKKFYDAGAMQKFQEEALKDTNVIWIAINSSAPGKEGYFATDKEANDALAAKGFKGTAYVRDESGKLGKLFGAKTTPHIFIIDAKGNVAYQGAIDSIKSPDKEDIAKADNYVMNTLKALKEGKTPSVTSTDSYGCSVKYAE